MEQPLERPTETEPEPVPKGKGDTGYRLPTRPGESGGRSREFLGPGSDPGTLEWE